MAKSKNHTAHNQSYKAHKNGIKKPKRTKYISTKGVSCTSWSAQVEMNAKRRPESVCIGINIFAVASEFL
jgi:hypothetical protein